MVALKTFCAASGVAMASFALAATAHAQSQTPTQFVAEFSAENAGEEQVSDRRSPLIDVWLRPELTVQLLDAPDEGTQQAIGASSSNPLTVGTRLYGSSNRRSLFCHLINDRIAGSKGTCFRDFDNDGAFEQGVEVEAASLNTSVVLLDNNGAWTGGTFADRERLRPPLRYEAVPADQAPRYPGFVAWNMNVRTPDVEDYPIAITFTLHEGTFGRAGDVVGQCYLTTFYEGAPVTEYFYGNRITVLGFTEDGDLRYTVEPNPQPQTVGMIYRFETRSAYVGIALAENYQRLECPDEAAFSPPAE